MKIIQFTTDNREQAKDYETPEPHFGAAPHALLEGFSTIPDVEVHVVSCLRQSAPSPELIFDNIHYHSVLVPKSGWMNTFYQGCIRATRSLVGEIAPEIVHGQGTERDCSMNAVFSGKPNVITIHGNMAELNRLGITFQSARIYGMLASRMETFCLKRTRGIFCNSAYTESLVNPRARSTWRVPNAIRKCFFQPPLAEPSEERPLILNVGQLGVRKRQLEVLRMARRVYERGGDFTLIFTGALSEADEYCRTFLGELKMAEKMGYARHAGFLAGDDLVRLMDQSCGFIHFPSEEAFGLVVAEAMARGLKFFGADLGGISEIAPGIPDAELHSDIGTLEKAFEMWLAEGARRPPGCAEIIGSRYSPEVIARRHFAIYQEVLS